MMAEVYLPFTVAGIGDIRRGACARRTPPASRARSSSQVYAIDQKQPVADVQTLDALLKEDEYATPRFNLTLLSRVRDARGRPRDRRASTA